MYIQTPPFTGADVQGDYQTSFKPNCKFCGVAQGDSLMKQDRSNLFAALLTIRTSTTSSRPRKLLDSKSGSGPSVSDFRIRQDWMAEPWLILRGSALDVVDHEDFDRAFPRFQLQSDLLLDGREK